MLLFRSLSNLANAHKTALEKNLESLPGESYYEGEFQNDKKHGRGKTVNVNGGVYDGEYSDGKRNGKGTLTLATGEVFSGTFENDRRADGHGTCVYTDGTRYEGSFVNVARHGKGTMTFNNGNMVSDRVLSLVSGLKHRYFILFLFF